MESLRVSAVQLVAIELAQELKEYCFELKASLCETRDLGLWLRKKVEYIGP